MEVADFIAVVLPQLQAGEPVILRGYTAIHAAESLELPLALAAPAAESPVRTEDPHPRLQTNRLRLVNSLRY